MNITTPSVPAIPSTPPLDKVTDVLRTERGAQRVMSTINLRRHSHGKHPLVRYGGSENPLSVVGAVVAAGVKDFLLPSTTKHQAREGQEEGRITHTQKRVHIKGLVVVDDAVRRVRGICICMGVEAYSWRMT